MPTVSEPRPRRARRPKRRRQGASPPKTRGTKTSRTAGTSRAAEDEIPTREVLLQAAGRVFARKGYRAATVDDVAAAAGLSKGAVYWHFESKEELLLALLEEQVDSALDGMIGSALGRGPEEPIAQDASGGLAQLLERRREALLLLNEFWALAARDPGLRRHFLRRQRRLRKALRALMKQRYEQLGIQSAIPLDQLATGMLALGVGLAMVNLTDPDAAPPQLFGELLSLISEGNSARSKGTLVGARAAT